MASQTAPGDANTPAPSSLKQPDSPAEPFPSLEGSAPSPASPARRSTQNSETNRDRGESSTSTLAGRFRSASKKFEESNPPAGFMLATAQIGSSIPSLTDIRRGSYGSEGWSAEGQYIEKERRASLVRRGSSQTSEDFARRRSSAGGSSPTTGKPGGELRHESLQETVDEHMPLGATTPGVETSAAIRAEIPMSTIKSNEPGNGQGDKRTSNDTSITPTNSAAAAKTDAKYRTTPFENGYQFPPKRKWTASTVIFLKAFWKFFITPIGFLVVIYGLNVVAWGGMLFLLLCNASPAMCKPTCNDINSPRRIWIEIDSQILNALFCVTGFGTIPWRFRDLYYLLQFRAKKNQMSLRRLAGINRGWFRLPGSQNLPREFGPTEAQGDLASANIDQNLLAFPLAKTPDAPLTGVRAPPTAMWKLDFVVWTMVWNTFLQAVLSGFMWGLNRYKRPSWSTGLFVALACIVAACGGIMSFIEGKKVKGIEGVPLSDDDKAILERDRELGITHYNNINDEGPKEEKETGKEKTGLFRRHGKKTEAEEVKVEEAAIIEGSEQIVR